MAMSSGNSFGTRDKLHVGAQTFDIHRLEFLEKQGVSHLAKLPFSLRILLENLLRCEDGRSVRQDDIRALASWKPGAAEKESPSCPPASCFKNLLASPPWSISLPCAKPSIAWVAIQKGSTRFSLPSWSSITPCKSTALAA